MNRKIEKLVSDAEYRLEAILTEYQKRLDRYEERLLDLESCFVEPEHPVQLWQMGDKPPDCIAHPISAVSGIAGYQCNIECQGILFHVRHPNRKTLWAFARTVEAALNERGEE